MSTSTLYYGGYTTTITITNSFGEQTVVTTYVPPSTVIVVKEVVYTAVAIDQGTAGTSGATIILHDFISHNLWGVSLSLLIATSTLIFMTFA